MAATTPEAEASLSKLSVSDKTAKPTIPPHTQANGDIDPGESDDDEDVDEEPGNGTTETASKKKKKRKPKKKKKAAASGGGAAAQANHQGSWCRNCSQTIHTQLVKRSIT